MSNEVTKTENQFNTGASLHNWDLCRLRQTAIEIDGVEYKPTLSFSSDRHRNFFIHVCMCKNYYVLVHEDNQGNLTKMVKVPFGVFRYMQQLEVPGNKTIN